MEEPSAIQRRARRRAMLLKMLSLVCFLIAYRLAAHGRTMNNGVCLGLGVAALVAAVLLVVCAIRTRPK